MNMILALTLVFGYTLTGCAAEQNEMKTQNDFVFNLYRIVTKDKTNDNVAVSPYCAELLLDFVRSGAAGETKAEIDKVLAEAEKIPEKIQRNGAVSDSPLTTAAALWTQQGHSLLPEFLDTAKKEFDAAVEQVDFTNNANEAVKRINDWCAKKTKDKILTLFEKLDPTTRCVLASAVYFAADWKVPFEKEATYDGSFTLTDGTKIKTPMMSQRGHLKYGETNETLVLELPYKNEGYAMLLLLPKDPINFAQWESKMTTKTLTALRAAMQPAQIDLRMPRFIVESDISMNESLKQLGMPTAFSRDADFTKITGQKDLYLSEVRQKIVVKVNEVGTEAAAVTSAIIAVKSIPLNTKTFFADRPFLYVIVKDNTILFLGRFIKPDVEKEQPFVDPGLTGEGGAFS